jgi:ubiquinone/menaquinone biosynthesis C-methylase UbiE
MFKEIEYLCAKTLMQLGKAEPNKNPPLWESNLDKWEIFKLDDFTQGSPEIKHMIMQKSAEFTYNQEKNTDLFSHDFEKILPEEFMGKSVLDLGCFTGGRLCYWKEKYNFGTATGIDINPIFAEAGKLFSAQKEVNINFHTGYGERLPFENNSFDFIISHQVFEHVQKIEEVMSECYRTLKPNGRLLVTFPQFYHPLGSHLGSVTWLPGLQYFFSGEALTKAYNDIILERGPEASWYSRDNQPLKKWEKLPSLNGTTVRDFKKIIKKQGWEIDYWKKDLPQNSIKNIFLKYLLFIPGRLPVFEEVFLWSICCILKKKHPDTINS